MLLTRSPVSSTPKSGIDPRLACVRPAASVHPEPGSNSPLKDRLTTRATQSMQRRFEDHHTPESAQQSMILHYLKGLQVQLADRSHRTVITANGVVSQPHPPESRHGVSLAFGTLCSSQRAVRDPQSSARKTGRLPTKAPHITHGQTPSGATNTTTRHPDCPTKGPWTSPATHTRNELKRATATNG